MRDLKDRLRVLDQARAPEMWHDASTRRAESRAALPVGPTRTRGRLFAAALALIISVGSLALVWRAFGGSRGPTPAASTASVGPSVSSGPGGPSFDGWIVAVSVTPSEFGPLKISVGDITAAPSTDSKGWLQHDITLENTGSRTLAFGDTRTSVFLGPPPRSLIAADTGCGYAASSKTAPVKAGVCRAYLDAITLEPGQSVTRQISLWKELNGMPELMPGTYTFTKVLRYRSAGQPGSETEATVHVTYTVEQATASPGSPASIPSARACGSPDGSVNDVAHEPDWRRWADYASWTTDDGCLVRIDVVAERPGPSHCGWEDAQVLITGDPLGSPYGTRHDATVHYIRDPGGVFGDEALAEGFDPDATLPADAVYSGFRSDARELWTAASDPNTAYIVDGGTAERWPEGEQLVCD